MKATKLVIGAGMLIAMAVAAMPGVAAADYVTAVGECDHDLGPIDQAQCFVNVQGLSDGTGDDCTIGKTAWRTTNGVPTEPVNCSPVP